MSIELKQCPFCGGAAVLLCDSVRCTCCGVTCQVVAVWNKRVVDPLFLKANKIKRYYRKRMYLCEHHIVKQRIAVREALEDE